ncbi:hypothetical protein CBM2626_A120007 [Cupriavidus taiwanensis]|nr:hypothetical protein CBM2626_A120007 [Cupriavidus taiwanensis]
MKNPSRHWVSIVEFERHATGLPRKTLIRLLRRCDRTIRDWQAGRRPIPAWTIDTLRVHRLEVTQIYREMFADVPQSTKAGAGL